MKMSPKVLSMKAMILAAGLGTRLRPLTTDRPKALVPVGNRPVIDRGIAYLKEYGVDHIVVNAHHHHQRLIEYLDGGRPFDLPIQVLVEPTLMDTGGGIRNASSFLDTSPFIVINGDILTDIDLGRALSAHKRSHALVTLVLHDYSPFNQIAVDDNMKITDIATKSRPNRLAFTGIHILEPEIMEHIPPSVPVSIVQCYRELINAGKPIMAYISNDHYWQDIGTIETYLAANQRTAKVRPFLVGSDCSMDPSVRLGDWAVIGPNGLLEKGVEITRSVLWENVTVRRGTKIIHSVIRSSNEVTTDVINTVL
ncbi:MAG: NDP-sugar synthase [Thermodesulfobacteriota bacterium]|nr:NDP-sugar synthase [Thermodesulfobacteriota bacterium]